jgi:SAM-dependent methyltransferase
MASATGKRLLALVRGGDYAHPGEEAANELLFAGLRRDPGRRVLDAGCGGAGTAAWVQRRGLGAVTGIEIDAATVRLARERHPEVTVIEGDLQRAGGVVAGPFDLLYAMTAIYAAADHTAVFAELGALAAPDGELRLLEYADPEGRFAAATCGTPSLSWWRPLAPRGLPDLLAATGWSDVSVRDLHPELVHWYADLCAHITARRDDILCRFGRDWYEFVVDEYTRILELVRWRVLGGVLVRARRSPTPKDLRC